MSEKKLTFERTITVWPGSITRDCKEVQYQTQKLREQGCAHIEYQQITDDTAKLLGSMTTQ